MKQHLQIALDHEPLAWINGVVYSNRPAWYNVTARALHMDLIVPKERPHHAPQPAVLFLCGGAYMVMDRSIWLPELMTLARAGYTVASMEYRTSNEAAFPAALEDVKTAIRFLRAHAEEYCVDPARIFLMGESAGGTLAWMIDWRVGLCSWGIFLVLVIFTQYVSLGSLAAAAMLASTVCIFIPSPTAKILAILSSALIIFAHRENIKRLRNGTESKLDLRGGPKNNT